MKKTKNTSRNNVTLWITYDITLSLSVRWSNLIVQIVDIHPNDVGMHWICFSKFNCDDDVVNLYDSAGGTYISSAAEICNCKHV